MKALVFDLSLVKYLIAKAVGPKARRLHRGPGSCFELRDVPAPTRPADDWVTLAPILTGMCGSDLGAIFFKMSPAMSAISLSPGDAAVFGHEILARVVEVGPGAKGTVKEGDRVVVDPVLACDVRGESPRCGRCAVGEYATCEKVGTATPKGVMLGACTAYPGGFSERMVAHRSQLFRVPDSVPDDVAVLAEPLAVTVHAVLRHPPKKGEKILVLGGGMIAFGTLWAIREICPEADVTLFTVEDYQIAIAEKLGAHRAWSPKGGALIEQAAKETGSKTLKPMIGRPFLAGGFDRIYDCVGSHASIDDALRIARGGATIVLVGAAAVLPPLDLTFLWNKELKFEGTAFYGTEDFRGKRQRTFEATLDLMSGTKRELAPLVTHHFALDDYEKAIDANVDRRASKSIKTAFRI
ncbi:MAG TPA: alcohol dehydrogenase catalytic domain-containing protein [Polyangiaceae bacterium]